MHYYQFNIGDYASHTRHLTLLEDLAYRLLLDLYYLHEKPLIGCPTTVARSIGMRDHVQEVTAVLEEFFILEDGCWTNHRADLEIEKYRAKSEQASRAGKASAERKKNTRSTPVLTDVQPNINQEPLNINQEPVTKNQEPNKTKTTAETKTAKFNPAAYLALHGVELQVAEDWMKLRKAKKAAVTQTAPHCWRYASEAFTSTIRSLLPTPCTGIIRILHRASCTALATSSGKRLAAISLVASSISRSATRFFSPAILRSRISSFRRSRITRQSSGGSAAALWSLLSFILALAHFCVMPTGSQGTGQPFAFCVARQKCSQPFPPGSVLCPVPQANPQA